MNISRPLSTRREIALATAVAIVTGSVVAMGWARPLERPVGDLLFRLVSMTTSETTPVVVVAIDDRSVERRGPLPWHRAHLASLIAGIGDHGPSGLVVDILLTDPVDREGDDMLAQVLEKNDAILAAALRPDGGWLLPLDRFGGDTVAAHSHAEVDSDGVVRSLAYTKQSGGLSLPALSVAAARRAGWEGSSTPGGRFFPDFRESPSQIETVSAMDVTDGSTSVVPRLQGRLVFLGVTAAGASDQFFVPVGESNRPTPGVLIHAAATSSLLRGGLVNEADIWLVISIAFAVSFAVQRLRTASGRLRVVWITVGILIVLLLAYGALWTNNTRLPVVALIVAAVVSAGAREAIESKTALAETGEILASLIREDGPAPETEIPRGVQGRLEMVKKLQHRITDDRNLRRTLLEGLNEGVVLWDGYGAPILWNRALEQLWGDPPEIGDFTLGPTPSQNLEVGSTTREIDRGSRVLEIEIVSIEDGHLGLIRDVTERAELDRRRRETHRLVSHELKTPLASISGFGEMLQTYDMSGDELEKVAGMIRSEADRLGEMVRVFLDIERIGARRWEDERSPIDLGSLVENRVETIRSSGEAGGRAVEVDADEGCTVAGIEPLIPRLVDNLVGNAIKFTGESGRIAIRVTVNEDASCTLEVEDNGIGIPGESLPKLFEKFYRVPGTDVEGTGLGLALVKEIVDMHGSSIQVESVVGEGTRFRVRFPAIGEKE